MYIGKVEVNSSWQKLESLIKAQISGQSSFSFQSGHIYVMQCEGAYGVRFCSAASAPTDPSVGFRIIGTDSAQYEKESGADLYVRTIDGGSSSVGVLHVAEQGE